MNISFPVEVGLAVAIPVISFVVWLLRLEGTSRVHTAALARNDTDHGEIKEHLEYIRERIDKAINGKV